MKSSPKIESSTKNRTWGFGLLVGHADHYTIDSLAYQTHAILLNDSSKRCKKRKWSPLPRVFWQQSGETPLVILTLWSQPQQRPFVIALIEWRQCSVCLLCGSEVENRQAEADWLWAKFTISRQRRRRSAKKINKLTKGKKNGWISPSGVERWTQEELVNVKIYFWRERRAQGRQKVNTQRERSHI